MPYNPRCLYGDSDFKSYTKRHREPTSLRSLASCQIHGRLLAFQHKRVAHNTMGKAGTQAVMVNGLLETADAFYGARTKLNVKMLKTNNKAGHGFKRCLRVMPVFIVFLTVHRVLEVFRTPGKSPVYSCLLSNMTEPGIILRVGFGLWEALVFGVSFGMLFQNVATTFLTNFLVSTMLKDIR